MSYQSDDRSFTENTSILHNLFTCKLRLAFMDSKSPSISSSSHKWKYDVFLSFRELLWQKWPISSDFIHKIGMRQNLFKILWKKYFPN
ncbi:hypothetical protein CMV_024453 [Castanea mollissima]|uniref:Uncharacterized protein n=1 Tax=Castanea mollissima TaxID=60419 RepID=A0A8J4V5T6_9ROSI|nr:hypothetical protein CMV_024453 [Castanea mollissima]